MDIKESDDISFDEFKSKYASLTSKGVVPESAAFIAELLSIDSHDSRLSEFDTKVIALETRIAFRDLIKTVSMNNRLLITMEDVQYIDSTCLDTLKFIISNCNSEHRILFILLYRNTHEDILHTIRKDIELSLSELTPRVSSSILNTTLREFTDKVTTAGEELENFVLEHSHGNPLFIKTLITDLHESGIIKYHTGKWEFTIPVKEIYVPSSLTGLLQSRLDNLPKKWKDILLYASVFGIDFDLSVFRTLIAKLGLEPISQISLNGLVNLGYLIHADTPYADAYQFRHILLRDSAYSTILDRNLKLLHRFAGEILEDTSHIENERKYLMLLNHFEKAHLFEKAIHWGLKVLDNFETTCRYQEGLDTVDRLSEWIEKDLDIENRILTHVNILNLKSKFLGELGEWKEAHEIIESSLTLADSSGNENLLLRCKILLVTGYVRSGNFAKASALATEMYDNPNAKHHSEIYSKLLRHMGTLAWRQSRFEKANLYYTENLEYAKANNNDLQKAISLGNLAMVESSMGNPDAAIELTEEKLHICKKQGNRKEQGIALGNLGSYYGMKGSFDKAEECFKQEYTLLNETKRREGLLASLANLGTVAKLKKNYDECIEYYFKALEIAEYMGNKPSLAHIEGNLGGVYRNISDSESAILHISNSIALAEELSDYSLLGLNHRRLAYCLLDMKDFREAEIHFRDSIKSYKSTKHMKDMLDAIRSLAEFYYERNRHSDASNLCSDYIAKYEQEPDHEEVIQSLREILSKSSSS